MGLLLKDKTLFVPKNIYEQVSKLIVDGNNVTLLWMPKFTRTGFGISLQNSSAFKELKLTLKFKKHHFVYLDLNLEIQELKDIVVMQLSKYSGKYNNIYELLNNITAKNDRIIFIFDNITKDKTSIVQYFLSLKSINLSKIQYIFMVLESDYKYLKLDTSSLGPIFYNQIIVPYYTKLEVFEFLELHSPTKFTADENEKIFRYIGGISSMLRNFIRVNEKFDDVDKAILSTEFKQTMNLVWSRFTSEEKDVLLKVITKNDDYNKEIFNYMCEHKLIIDNKVVGGWIRSMLEIEQKISGLNLNNNGLFYMGKSLSDILTKQEEQLIMAFIKNNGFLSKREIADAIWAENSNDKYSEWAISKLISTIREKFKLIGIAPENITTLKGRGFRLNKIPIRSELPNG